MACPLRLVLVVFSALVALVLAWKTWQWPVEEEEERRRREDDGTKRRGRRTRTKRKGGRRSEQRQREEEEEEEEEEEGNEEETSGEMQRSKPTRMQTRTSALAARDKEDQGRAQHQEETTRLRPVDGGNGDGRHKAMVYPSIVGMEEVGRYTRQKEHDEIVTMSVYSWTGVWEDVKENGMHFGTTVFEMATGLYLWRLYREHAVVDAGGVIIDASVVKVATAS